MGSFFEGIKLGLGFIFVIALLGSVSAVGFHVADEIVSGNFVGNFDFNGEVNFTDANVIGLSVGGVPIGTISSFNLASCPSGWILADGSSGTPDLRGVFIRGLDNGRGFDTGRTLGSYQGDDLKSHTHKYTSPIASGQPNAKGIGAGISSPSVNHAVWSIPNDDNTLIFGGTETRPKNVALIYCMKVGTNPSEEAGIWSIGPTTITPTDNTKHISTITPTENDHVATKGYVDSNGGGSFNIVSLDTTFGTGGSYTYVGSSTPLLLFVELETFGGYNSVGAVEVRWLNPLGGVVKDWTRVSGTNVNSGGDGGSGMSDSELATLPFISGSVEIEFRNIGHDFKAHVISLMER